MVSEPYITLFNCIDKMKDIPSWKREYHPSEVQLSLENENKSVITFMSFKNSFLEENLNFYIKSLYVDLVEMEISLLSTMFTSLSIFSLCKIFLKPSS